MIFDNIKNCELYYGINKRFEKAFDFIKKACEENFDIGRYEIDGKNLYAMVQEYNTKESKDGKFESHKNYIDIQHIISGSEKMEVTAISGLKPRGDYNQEKDVIFYEDTDDVTVGLFRAGEYAVFFPHDAHKPNLLTDNAVAAVKKIVVKVKIE